jgi:Fe-Mn family superoxide dismutase
VVQRLLDLVAESKPLENAMENQPYRVQDFKISGLKGISDRTLEMHLKLYEGYVKNTNMINEHLPSSLRRKKTLRPILAIASSSVTWASSTAVWCCTNTTSAICAQAEAERRRKVSSTPPRSASAVLMPGKLILSVSGSMRGVGWAVLYQDPVTHNLSNHWIELHQQGVPPGFKPILVMDVWEHAFLLDYQPSERSKYIDAFFENVDWQVVEKQLGSASATRPVG